MSTITKSLTAVDQVSAILTLAPGKSATYDLSGTFVQTDVLQSSRNAGLPWETVRSLTAAGSGTVKNEEPSDLWLRWKCAADTSGTGVAVIADVADLVEETRNSQGDLLMRINEEGIETALFASPPTTSSGVGAKNGSTVSVSERGDGVVHQTVLTLASTSVTVANTTGASFGGVKLYDFPEGRIAVLGVTANLSFNWAGTDIAATGSGDFSLGSTITEDATLDGTDVNLLPSTGLLDPFVAGVGTGKGALAAGAQFDGTTTPLDMNLNIIIDDADVDDADTDPVLVTGTITITWINLGDY